MNQDQLKKIFDFVKKFTLIFRSLQVERISWPFFNYLNTNSLTMVRKTVILKHGTMLDGLNVRVKIQKHSAEL